MGAPLKKVRFSSVLISAAVVLTILIIALNFNKKVPIYSYILVPKTTDIENNISNNLKTEKQDSDIDENIILDLPSEAEAENELILEFYNEETPEEAADIEDIVFYTNTGTKWHSTKDCTYLKKSKEILEGSLESVIDGLSPCSACASSDTEIKPLEQQDNNQIIIYYYTESGTKWHIDKACRYLKNSKIVLEGDKKTVEEKSLTPCSGCAK